MDPLPALVLVCACAVQSVFGFGLALIAVPLLSTSLPLALVTPLLALLSMTLGGVTAWRTRASVRTELLWRLLASAALGVPFGVALVVVLDENTARLALGTVTVLAALHGLLGREDAISLGPGAVWPFGVVAGVLGGAWNLMGPPLVLLMQWSGLDPSTFRSTLHAFAFTINLLVVGSWMVLPGELGGVSPLELARWYALALVPLVAGGWIGGALVGRIETGRYRNAVYVLLLVTGSGLVVAALG